ncbi:RNA polymerase subunit sigma-70 [Nocardioides sp. Leaf307]|nr:RNA polymerase subunit sigma-70 [Nocardioides sp. Leaf285]KQQ44268.1 RNA polymerase subunit sigma-70 [Nocardioides sp. Leaf307]
MYRYALRLVGGNDTDAAEVTQEALISAWKDLGTFQGRSSLKTWLFRLVHRRAVDLQRHRRPTPINDDLLSRFVPEASDNPLQDVLDAELLAALQQALDELPWHQRAVWLLREVEGMSYDEIGEALALPVGSVRGHLHRGRRTLAERMARWR